MLFFLFVLLFCRQPRCFHDEKWDFKSEEVKPAEVWGMRRSAGSASKQAEYIFTNLFPLNLHPLRHETAFCFVHPRERTRNASFSNTFSCCSWRVTSLFVSSNICFHWILVRMSARRTPVTLDFIMSSRCEPECRDEGFPETPEPLPEFICSRRSFLWGFSAAWASNLRLSKLFFFPFSSPEDLFHQTVGWFSDKYSVFLTFSLKLIKLCVKPRPKQVVCTCVALSPAWKR